MTHDIEEDPYLVKSWEEYCKTCLEAGRLDLFKSGLSQYIWETNNRFQAEINAFCNQIQGDIVAYELLRKKRFPNI